MRVDFTAAALRYAELGWKVFPLAAGSKVPAIKGGHAVKDASAYGDDIRAWGRLYPGANIGLACGLSSGIIVVDVDPRNGGDASLRALAAAGRIIPPGPRARTGNGGVHLFFRFHPKVANSKNRLGRGIDVKSTGGYVVAAPSWIRPSKDGKGGAYCWEVSPFDVPVPRMPVWMTTLLAPVPRPEPRFESDGNGGDIEGLARFVARSPVGERNNRLHWAACRAGELVARRKVSAGSSIRRLAQAAGACGLKGPEVLRTIHSGLKAGESG
jgi:hypothetical protein